MKKISVIAIAFLLSSDVYSQYKLGVGDAQLNAGVGLSTQWGSPVYVGFDYGVHKYISVGAEASFRSYWDRDRDRQNTLAILGNGNFHFSGLLNIPDEWDIYMGLNLGGYYNSASTGKTSGGVGIGAQFGGRYYFTDHFGINLEAGGGTIFDWGKLGISYVF
jgi:outer membrane immunogenic protein